MSDPRIDKLAQVLVHYSVAAKPRQLVGISGYPFSPQVLPLMEAVVREVYRAGAHPIPYMQVPNTEGFDRIFFGEANDDQLKFREPWAEQMIRSLDCDIGIMASTNTRRLSGADSSKMSIASRAVRDLVTLYFKRAAEGSLRWVLCATPTAAYAQDAEMSLPEFEDFVFGCTYADQEDPVSTWRSMSETQSVLVKRLAGKRSVSVKGPHVDLTFSIEDRVFINCDGRANMPDGEIFTGPVEESVNGWIESSFPAIFRGVEVGQVRLVLKEGRAVEADAEKHQDHLVAMLDTDEGARRMGEFGIGTNDRIAVFTKNMLFDEKIGGTVHFALGAGFPETGAKNESSIHWDLLCDMRHGGQILVDGKLFYESGRFLD
jgi:aminopeptidase